MVEDNLAEARLLREVLNGVLFKRFHWVHVQRLGEAIAHLSGEATHSIQTSADSSEAHPIELPFDVILLDLTLPDSAGLLSLDRLIGCAPHLPIVVLTNTNDDELAIAAVRHGAQDYLVKRQINADVLVRSLRYAIERKQAAEALREANEILEQRVQARTIELESTNVLLRQEIEGRQRVQERLELAQQVGKIGTFEFNLQAHELTWSPELEALYGCQAGAFNGQYAAWMQTLHEDDRDRVEQEFRQAMDRDDSFDTDFRIITPTSELRWIAVKGSVFRDAHHHPLRMIGIHMDITEKKRFEEQFLRAQRLESLGTLASGIAHDLNNILTPILVVTQLLPLKLPRLSEQHQQMLETLETSAHRGADLVKQILSFARGVEGKRVSLQLNYLLQEIEKLIQQTLPKSIDIETYIPSHLWPVSGDATHLHQVFMNLCVNARDAMPEGGTLHIAAENRCLSEQEARQFLGASAGQYVVVSVEDTGIGIAPSVFDRIFDPFFTTKPIGQGTGLGLSAVLGIIKSHGGFIDVQSQVSQGSKFSIFLPSNESATETPHSDLQSFDGDAALVLVVDDEEAIRETAKLVLESQQYRVLTAQNGVEAIALFAEHVDEIACVVMDLMMPEMDGMSAIPLMRRLKPDAYIIAMSGYSSSEAIAQASSRGFQYFIHKPFDTQELLQALYQAQLSSAASDTFEPGFKRSP